MRTEQSNKNDTATQAMTIGSSVIPILNKLQDILSSLGSRNDELNAITLPQVVVIGSQSSGKSSVLEALVGRDFLPRGCGICTRRPLVLMLENQPSGTDDDKFQEWGEFRHLPGQSFFDFSKIRHQIQEETERVAGNNNGVSEKQIRLKICSQRVLNMTLVDLPGITKVPVGDQPSDIEARIRKMIMAYISQENCIILAVSPANSDLATSDALQMARQADPTGSRTIGVITKLDIMDRGTDARKFLLGRVVPLRLGYVGVVNRCQEDINHNQSIEEALANEERFFRDNPVYNSLSDYCGIPQLAKKLNKILEQHVRMVLPKLKSDLKMRLLPVENELQTYGGIAESTVEQGMVLLKILTRYCGAFMSMLDGTSHEMTSTELCGGARIRYIFQSVFAKSLEDVDPCEHLTDDDIQTTIQNATGSRNTLFLPELPFEILVRRQMARLLDPSLRCLRFVYDELVKISRICEANELRRFPFLKKRLHQVIGKFLRDAARPAGRMIENIIEMEMDYINSSNPNFIGGDKAVELAKQQLRLSQDDVDNAKALNSEGRRRSQPVVTRSVVNGAASNEGSHLNLNNDRSLSIAVTPAVNWIGGKSAAKSWALRSIFRSREVSEDNLSSCNQYEAPQDGLQLLTTIKLKEPPRIIKVSDTTDHEALEIIVTKSFVRSYYDIVRKSIQDQVPKAIMHFLVNHTRRNLQENLIQNLYRQELFEELLQEDEGIVTKRKRAQEMYEVLVGAAEAIEEVQYDALSQWPSSPVYCY